MTAQAVSSREIVTAAPKSVATAEPCEAKTKATVKRGSISAVPGGGAEMLPLRDQACDDVSRAAAYLCRHPEELGRAPIQTSQDFGNAQGVKITPDGDRYIVQIRRYTVSEIFNGKPNDEFLPDLHFLSPEQFAAYLALEKEAQESQTNIDFVTYFLRDRQKELARITGGKLDEGSLDCEITKQLDGTFLIKITCKRTRKEGSGAFSATQLKEFVAYAQRTIETETKQKNLKRVQEYLASHPDVLGIATTFSVSGIVTKVDPFGGHFTFNTTFTEKTDGSYHLNVKYSIYGPYEGSTLQQYYAKVHYQWKAYETNFSVPKAKFAAWAEAQRLEEIRKASS